MGEVAADAAAFDDDVGRGLGGARVLIAEAHMGMDEIADRLHPRPAQRRLAEARPCGLHQALGLAISAGQQEHEGVVRQFGDFVLARRRLHRVRQS